MCSVISSKVLPFWREAEGTAQKIQREGSERNSLEIREYIKDKISLLSDCDSQNENLIIMTGDTCSAVVACWSTGQEINPAPGA